MRTFSSPNPRFSPWDDRALEDQAHTECDRIISLRADLERAEQLLTAYLAEIARRKSNAKAD